MAFRFLLGNSRSSMKSDSYNAKKGIKNQNNSQIKEALKWIESLTPQEIKKLEQLSRVKLAVTLLEAYSKLKTNKSKRQNKKPL